MGRGDKALLHAGETVYVPTGGMVPEGTEAMVMIEYTESFSSDELAIYIQRGRLSGKHDADRRRHPGRLEAVFEAGHTIRPQDVGVLSSVGVVDALVYKKPGITII